MIIPAWFWRWARWRLGRSEFKPYGPANPAVRPKDAPKLIPAWAWTRLKQITAVRPIQDPLAFWRSVGGWESWGLVNGQFTPDTLCVKAKGMPKPCKWIGVQDTTVKRSQRDAIKAACARHGLKLAVWNWAVSVDHSLEIIDFWNPDAYVANVEHFGPWDNLATRVRAKHPVLPLGVFTNFWGAGAVPKTTSATGYSKADADPWVRNAWAYITESYMVNEQGEQPTLSPAHLDWAAKTHLGVPETFPCFGIYRVPPSYYSKYLSLWPNHSWYLLEYA